MTLLANQPQKGGQHRTLNTQSQTHREEACCSGLRPGNVYFWYVLIKILAVRPRHIKVRPVPERSIIGDHSLCRWLSGSASRSQAERLKLLRMSFSSARTSRNVRPMLQRSSRAFPMVRPVAGHHTALVCMPGCHRKHPRQPGLQTWYHVIQATRGWLSSPVEGARPSGDHLRPSYDRTKQARYRRAIDAGCRPTR